MGASAAQTSILIIYTGGTIGMVQDAESNALRPFDFDHLSQQVPELNRFQLHLDAISFEQPIDSSDVDPNTWVKLAHSIAENYDQYDGFVVLHGTDTMAYTASALSFMLKGLSKPVILTGSQLPIGMIRTDGKENLITAVEVAAAKMDQKARVPEVAICFESDILRGNRAYKHSAEQFEAFLSPNYPLLAKAGVHLRFKERAIAHADERLIIHPDLDTNVARLPLFPGIQQSVVESVLNTPGLKACVIETFGSGNGPTTPNLLEPIKTAIDSGIILLNITQCRAGSVEQGRYQTSKAYEQMGVISGHDMTVEAGLTKLMHLLGTYPDRDTVKTKLAESISGEMTVA